ncbi:hypothetical protein SAMN04487905_1065 [Actinopolyspora xinjiangensis]|uniref:Uncharacterized protein n=1 Tax=Actinopolyspora xinjiangensis TaxID=405564 RepID=A0A1H0U2F8_9ACTN|nr:hypothetical protein [Actinopolyspora xinjiangensis]SDP60373.1 hypothetical protein SAMN04487905_1065 [Actinopolyspora xinjiangensis]
MNPTPPNVDIALRVTHLRATLHALSFDLSTQSTTAEQLTGAADYMERLAADLRGQADRAPSRGPRLLAEEGSDA